MGLPKTVVFLGILNFLASSVALAADVVVTDIKGSGADVLTTKITEPLLKLYTDNMKMPALFTGVPPDPKNPMLVTDKGAMKIQDTKAQTLAYNKAAMRRALPLPMSVKAHKPGPEDLYANIYIRNYFSTTDDPKLLMGLNIANLLQEDVVDSVMAYDVIRILTIPFPNTITIKDPAGYDEKIAFGKQLLDQTLYSASISALAEMAARRTPGPNTGDKSVMEIMREQAMGRITSPTWQTKIATEHLSQEALLKEIAQMQAFNLYMQYQQFRLNEQAVSLLVNLASAQARITPIMEGIRDQMSVANGRYVPPPR